MKFAFFTQKWSLQISSHDNKLPNGFSFNVFPNRFSFDVFPNGFSFDVFLNIPAIRLCVLFYSVNNWAVGRKDWPSFMDPGYTLPSQSVRSITISSGTNFLET